MVSSSRLKGVLVVGGGFKPLLSLNPSTVLFVVGVVVIVGL